MCVAIVGSRSASEYGLGSGKVYCVILLSKWCGYYKRYGTGGYKGRWLLMAKPMSYLARSKCVIPEST